MAEESWHEARLIPTSGISGADEQERRATSALLSVMSVVKEFGRALLGSAGAISGTVETYIEVPFVVGERRVYPDGLIRVTRGKRQWTALVEVKTGKSVLEAEQLETYLDIARAEEFDALITISNEIPPFAGQHPAKIDKRKLRKVQLHHWSWSDILAAAVMQKEHRGISDPEQAWILGELIRYLEHPRSGALEFDDMGPNWVPVREAVAAGTLRATDKASADVAARFDALLRYASLRLGKSLGTEVLPVLSRKELADPSARIQSLATSLADRAEVEGAIRIPGAVAPIRVLADLRGGRITCSVELDAPKTGRSATRVGWVLRQLKNAPSSTTVEVLVANARGPGAIERLDIVRDDPGAVIADPKREIRAFRIALSGPSGAKRGRGRGSFIDSVLDLIDEFYGVVLQDLKAWVPAPPRMREREMEEEPTTALTSTALSSQDGPEEPTTRETGHLPHESEPADAASDQLPPS
jgi:hypothetical protein